MTERLNMRQVIIFLLMFVTALILHNTAKAQPNMNQEINLAVLTQQNAGYHFITIPMSSVDGQRSYRIYVAIPDQKAPPDGYPVFYALDGNAVLDFLTPDNLHLLAEKSSPPVLILLGNHTDKRYDFQARAFDYTIAPVDDNQDPLDPSRLNGGADLFLDFIQYQVMPAVKQSVPINLQQQTLWGHSYGGLFVVHTLLTRPYLFQHYVAADPSIWLHSDIIQTETNALLTQKVALAGKSLWMMNGKMNTSKLPKNPQIAARINTRNKLTAKQANLVKNIIDQLQHHTDLVVRYEQFPQENHGSLFGKSLQLVLFQPILKHKQ